VGYFCAKLTGSVKAQLFYSVSAAIVAMKQLPKLPFAGIVKDQC
jgi:hypothetical protein